ncbi:unnamed protein product, partial [Candidula unifasciata]
EKLEVLKSIYDVFHYKYGEDGSQKSFIVEISWPSSYPEELPVINMELFYNKHVGDLLGMFMTFSLFEWVKDNLDSFLSDQPETLVQPSTCKKERKEQLTKSQKRQIFDRFGATTDRPRGWNWIDIMKHLAQSGGQKIE